MEGGVLNVDFEARNPEGSDFHGIKKLLSQVAFLKTYSYSLLFSRIILSLAKFLFQLFVKANINLSALTDAFLSQNYIGSVVKVRTANHLPT